MQSAQRHPDGPRRHQRTSPRSWRSSTGVTPGLPFEESPTAGHPSHAPTALARERAERSAQTAPTPPRQESTPGPEIPGGLHELSLPWRRCPQAGQLQPGGSQNPTEPQSCKNSNCLVKPPITIKLGGVVRRHPTPGAYRRTPQRPETPTVAPTMFASKRALSASPRARFVNNEPNPLTTTRPLPQRTRPQHAFTRLPLMRQ